MSVTHDAPEIEVEERIDGLHGLSCRRSGSHGRGLGDEETTTTNCISANLH